MSIQNGNVVLKTTYYQNGDGICCLNRHRKIPVLRHFRTWGQEVRRPLNRCSAFCAKESLTEGHQHPQRKPGTAALAYNPRAEEEETEGLWGSLLGLVV